MDIVFGLFLFIGFFIILMKVRDFIKTPDTFRDRDRKLIEPVTKSYRGTGAERHLVSKLLRAGIPAQTIFHDLYVKKYNGNYSQIDLL